MSESYVQVSPDGSGKKIAAVVDDDSNYRQVVEIGGDGTDNFATVTAAGALKTDASATTQPVSGTFWQTTQPVSGTFWQATQPVSGTVAVSGTVTVAGTVAVSSVGGTVTISGTVAATQSGTWNVGLSAGTNNIGTVGTDPTAGPVTGQKTSNTAQVQLSTTSTVPPNGLTITAPSTNASTGVYYGATGVTTSTGDLLLPGMVKTLTCPPNAVYIIGSNNTDVVTWSLV